MITLPAGKGKKVYEITHNDVKVPETTSYDKLNSSWTNTNNRSVYIAPSTSILVNVTPKELQLVVGRNATNGTLQNVLGFAIKSKKPVVVLKCEALNNLQIVDRVVVLANEALKQLDTTEEEVLDYDFKSEEIPDDY